MFLIVLSYLKLSNLEFCIMSESNAQPPQKKPRFDQDQDVVLSSHKSAFEFQSGKIFDECFTISEKLEEESEAICLCQTCGARVGTTSRNAAYNLTVHLNSSACLKKLSVEKQSAILLAKLPGGILDVCYKICKNGNDIEVHCICCRDYGKPTIMKARAQNVVHNMQQHGESVDHRGAWQKSINATNTKSKQTSMTSFVGITTAPVVIAL